MGGQRPRTVRIVVTLKPGVLDAPGQAIRCAIAIRATFDQGDVARAAHGASKQGRSVQQAPEPSAQPAATAAAVARGRCLGICRAHGGAFQNLSLGHCPCLPALFS